MTVKVYRNNELVATNSTPDATPVAEVVGIVAEDLVEVEEATTETPVEMVDTETAETTAEATTATTGPRNTKVKRKRGIFGRKKK